MNLGKGDIMAELRQFKALTFDCYGTLIDWEGGIWDALQPLLMANGCDNISRPEALMAHAELESARQSAAPDRLYADILRDVHGAFAARFDLQTTDELDAAFGQSVPLWPAFPDTADALRLLKRHYKLIILSNVHRAGFAASNKKLGVEFDAIYTAEDIGSYKPAHRNFEVMLTDLGQTHGLEKTDILHTAQSLFHDHVPAAHFGLARCWIDRQNLVGGGNWGATAIVETRPDVDFLFPDMASMAAAVTAG